MKYVLVDMDGTIAEFYDKRGISIPDFPTGFFINKRPINIMIDAIKELYKNDKIIIMSNSPSEDADNEKADWLVKQGLYWDHIFVRYQFMDKGQAISNFIKLNNINPTDVILIDDDLRNLRNCEKLGVVCIHPSHILAEYQALQ